MTCDPGAIVPRAHGKAPVQAPALDTKVRPAPGVSVTCTAAALLGPAFVTVIV